ncbi:MAG TPA: hypothetical protein VHR66_04835 [Gemmataceae bacterium]|jgi:hypothetical protein|nr:hypothetical protein [Gemmataceae bacterium]
MTTLMVAILMVGADPKEPPARPPLTGDFLREITKQKDMLTIADLVAKLGPPDRYEHADLIKDVKVIADVQLIWEDDAVIEMRYKDQKLTALTARYSGRPASNRGPAVVLQLKPSAVMADVSKLLGNLGLREESPDGPVYKMNRKGQFEASITDGKFAGYTIAGGFHDPKKLDALPAWVARPALTRELGDRLAKEVKDGKLTRDDLLKKLGTPNLIAWPHDGSHGPKGSVQIAWNEVTRIETVFDKGMSVYLSGQFAAQLPIEGITPEAFMKLNHKTDGLREKVFTDALGKPAEEAKDKEGRKVLRWGSQRSIEAYLDADDKPTAVRFDGK